jgi:hypothetical protein
MTTARRPRRGPRTRPERQPAPAPVAITGADHRLEVAGDVIATLGSWRTMADAVVRFAGRT